MFGKWKFERVTLICVLLALCVGAVYLPAIFLDFTNYDDIYYVTENPHIRGGFTLESIGWAFTHTCLANWQPVTLMSHALDCQIYGLKAGGHHLTSVILHSANTIVLFLVLRSMTGAMWRSAMVAVLFALHPLHVESVAWISERKDVLSTLFGLLSLWAYVEYTKRVESSGSSGEKENRLQSPDARHAIFYYTLALVLFALGLMSKSMLVTWPCVMLLLDYWPLGRVWRTERKPDEELKGRSSNLNAQTILPLIGEKVPFFALSALMCGITFLNFEKGEAIAPLQDIPIGTRLLNVVISYAHYIEKLIWPTGLAPVYPYFPGFVRWQLLAAAVLLGAITALAIWKWKTRPYLLAGWAWYLGTLVPVIGVVQVGSHLMADRYTYIPAIGVMLMVAWLAADFVQSYAWRRIVAIIAVAGVFMACALVAQRQLMFWQNTETLFRHALAVTSKNYIAWNSLGFYFADHHEAKEAERCFRAALTIKPSNIYSLEKLGSVLIDQGRYDEAEASARKAAEVNPRMAGAHRTLGLALMKQGKTTEAIEHYQESLGLEPDNATTHYNFANALARLGQFEKAREQYQEAVRLDLTLADAHNNLGYMLAREGRLKEATFEFKTALGLRPDSWHARYGLGDALARQGKAKEAADEFLEVLRTEPKLALAQMQLNRIAWMLASNPNPQLRDGIKALELAERVCELTSHTNAIMLETLAAAQAEAGHFPAAISSAEQARKVALDAGQNEVARKADELAELFRAGRPYREGASGPR